MQQRRSGERPASEATYSQPVWSFAKFNHISPSPLTTSNSEPAQLEVCQCSHDGVAENVTHSSKERQEKEVEKGPRIRRAWLSCVLVANWKAAPPTFDFAQVGVFISGSGGDGHVHEEHAPRNEEPFRCLLGCQTFARRRDLTTHLVKKHGEWWTVSEKPFPCPECRRLARDDCTIRTKADCRGNVWVLMQYAEMSEKNDDISKD